MKKIALVSISVLAIVLPAFYSGGGAAAQAANPYPAGKSTFWAWQNRPDLPANLGEAKDWATNAGMQSWPVSAYPRPMSVAVYPPGVLGADAISGHVAVVKQVFGDGTYTASQMDEADCANSSANCGKVNTRTIKPAPGVVFIHYKVDTRTTWGFAGGAAGWTPIGMGLGTVQDPGWRYPLTGGEPQLVSPQLQVPLDAYNAVDVEMAIDPGVNDPTLSLFYATEELRDPVQAGAVRAVADGKAHLYHLPVTNWSGTLKALALRPAGIGSQGGVRIDRVRLTHDEPQTAPETIYKGFGSRCSVMN